MNGVERQLRKASGVVWTTRDYREIPIEELEDSHLINCIGYILKMLREGNLNMQGTPWRWNYVKLLVEEAEARGLSDIPKLPRERPNYLNMFL